MWSEVPWLAMNHNAICSTVLEDALFTGPCFTIWATIATILATISRTAKVATTKNAEASASEGANSKTGVPRKVLKLRMLWGSAP